MCVCEGVGAVFGFSFYIRERESMAYDDFLHTQLFIGIDKVTIWPFVSSCLCHCHTRLWLKTYRQMTTIFPFWLKDQGSGLYEYHVRNFMFYSLICALIEVFLPFTLPDICMGWCRWKRQWFYHSSMETSWVNLFVIHFFNSWHLLLVFIRYFECLLSFFFIQMFGRIEYICWSCFSFGYCVKTSNCSTVELTPNTSWILCVAFS